MASPSISAPPASFGRASRVPLKIAALMALAALGIQALLPIIHPAFSVLNLPLLVVVFVSLTIRAVIPAILWAMLIGWAQDGLTHDPVGLLGIVYSVLSYLVVTASLYVKLSLASVFGLVIAAAYLAHEILLYAIRVNLLGQDLPLDLGLWGALTALHAGLALLAYPAHRKLIDSS